MNSYTNLIQLFVKTMRIFGLNLTGNIRWFQVMYTVLCGILFSILTLLHFAFEEITLNLLSKVMESLFLSFNVTTKTVVLIVQFSKIKDLVSRVDRFWDFKHFKDKDFKEDLKKTLKFTENMFKIFIGIVIIGLVFFCLRPFNVGEMPINGYVPPFIPFSVLATINAVYTIQGAYMVISFDMVSCILITSLRSQFQIVNKELSLLNPLLTTDDEQFLKKIKIWVKYHNFLFKFFNDFNEVINIAFFINYFIIIFAVCFDFYVVLKTKPNLLELITIILYVSVLVGELALFYCYPCTLLLAEARHSLNVVYNLDWYKCKSIQIRKELVIIQQRTQKDVVISAGNMFLINMETCTAAFRTMLSFYTCLQAMDSKQSHKY